MNDRALKLKEDAEGRGYRRAAHRERASQLFFNLPSSP